MATIDATEARLTTHEELCALRYEQINARLKRLEGILMKRSEEHTSELQSHSST